MEKCQQKGKHKYVHNRNFFATMCSRLAQAKVPPPVIDMLRAGRLTALAKPDGGVRSIVAGDVIRRLVARTMAHQMAEIVERATAPHQYAFIVHERKVRVCGPRAPGFD